MVDGKITATIRKSLGTISRMRVTLIPFAVDLHSPDGKTGLAGLRLNGELPTSSGTIYTWIISPPFQKIEEVARRVRVSDSVRIPLEFVVEGFGSLGLQADVSIRIGKRWHHAAERASLRMPIVARPWQPFLPDVIARFKRELFSQHHGDRESEAEGEDAAYERHLIDRGPLSIDCLRVDGGDNPHLLLAMDVWYARPDQAGGAELWRLPGTGETGPVRVCGWYGGSTACQVVRWLDRTGVAIWTSGRLRIVDFADWSPQLRFAAAAQRSYGLQGGYYYGTWITTSPRGLTIMTQEGLGDEESEHGETELVWDPSVSRFAIVTRPAGPGVPEERKLWIPLESNIACDPPLADPAPDPADR